MAVTLSYTIQKQLSQSQRHAGVPKEYYCDDV
jgi:hypothetical protein